MSVASSVGRRAEKAIVLCAGAALFALATYVMLSYGFDAVVRCEVNDYRLLRQTRSAISEIAVTNSCGF